MRKCSMFSRIRSSHPSLAEPSHNEGGNDVFAGALQHPTHLESRPCSAAPSPCMCAEAESVCETEPPRRLSHPEGLRLDSYIYFLYNICTCSIHIYFLYNVCTCSIHRPHSNTLFRRPQTCTGAIWLSASRTRRCKCPSHSCCNHHCSIHVNSCQLIGWIYWRYLESRSSIYTWTRNICPAHASINRTSRPGRASASVRRGGAPGCQRTARPHCHCRASSSGRPCSAFSTMPMCPTPRA